MLNIGIEKIAFILLVALIVFGPARLPEIARTVGKFVRSFQVETSKAMNDLKAGIEPDKDLAEPFRLGIFDQPDAQAGPKGIAERKPSDAAKRWLDVPGFKPASPIGRQGGGASNRRFLGPDGPRFGIPLDLTAGTAAGANGAESSESAEKTPSAEKSNPEQ